MQIRQVSWIDSWINIVKKQECEISCLWCDLFGDKRFGRFLLPTSGHSIALLPFYIRYERLFSKGPGGKYVWDATQPPGLAA